MREGYKETVLGRVPAEWAVCKTEEILRIETGSKNAQDAISDGQYPFFTRSVKTQRIDSFSFDTEALFIAGEGIFLVKHYSGKFDVHQRTYVLTDLKAEPICLRYLKDEIQSRILKLVSTSVGSTVQSLRKPIIGSLQLLLPPLPEQQKIAEILSTVDEKIEVIGEQISQTRELKRGLMQRLLTKGIGHSRFKDSPLGEIPESWAILKFGKLIKSYGYGPRFNAKDYSEQGNVRTIRGTDIETNGDILYHQVPLAKLEYETVETHRLKDGDLVMITTADCGLTGVFIEQDIPFIPSAYAVRIRLSSDASPLFFKYVMQSELAKNQVKKFIRKGTVANLPGSDILKFKFPIPPFSEQERIASILTTVDEKLEVLQDKKQQCQELKKGLMQQLLTGKLRVKIKEPLTA